MKASTQLAKSCFRTGTFRGLWGVVVILVLSGCHGADNVRPDQTEQATATSAQGEPTTNPAVAKETARPKRQVYDAVLAAKSNK